MAFNVKIITFLLMISNVCCFALKPQQVLVVYNKSNTESKRIAQYYIEKRKLPKENLLAIDLSKTLADSVTRKAYDEKIAEPIRNRLQQFNPKENLRCILLTYGIPYKIIDDDQQKQTGASVDSELSLVMFTTYNLDRWQPNLFITNGLDNEVLTKMVSRLDGPDPGKIIQMIDKSIRAEKKGLNGIAYFDSRGLEADPNYGSYGYYDRAIRDAAKITKDQGFKIVEENTNELFAPGRCPQVALYCGWYSLKKYIPAFTFEDGAIGYHIASFEAVDIRDPNSSQWCPAMLQAGITATLGSVAEPYLHAFPEPDKFFSKLFQGHSLVEAFYLTKPHNSWQMILIGDPLYIPFRKD